MNYNHYYGIFNASLLNGIQPTGRLGLPLLRKCEAIPTEVLPFSEFVNLRDYTKTVHFYEHDEKFIRLWNKPWKYIPDLSKCPSVIGPDFSVFYKLPLYRQIESVGKSREITACLQNRGVQCIPNLRWGLPETYEYAFGGVESGGTVAVGTVGCTRDKVLRAVFEQGFLVMLDIVRPHTVVCVGSIKDPVFAIAEALGVRVVGFQSATSSYFTGWCVNG